MIVKQKNLRVFYITVDEKEAFLEYLKKNKGLLLEFFLLIDGKTDESIEEILDNEGFCYKNISAYSPKLLDPKKETKAEDKKEDSSKKIARKERLKIYERPIRSGEEISEELPVVVFGQVNSGAKLFCTQSVTVYGTVDGLVQCDGEFIVFQGLNSRGNLIFNGEVIDRELLKSNTLQKIALESSKVVIKEICASNYNR